MCVCVRLSPEKCSQRISNYSSKRISCMCAGGSLAFLHTDCTPHINAPKHCALDLPTWRRHTIVSRQTAGGIKNKRAAIIIPFHQRRQFRQLNNTNRMRIVCWQITAREKKCRRVRQSSHHIEKRQDAKLNFTPRPSV